MNNQLTKAQESQDDSQDVEENVTTLSAYNIFRDSPLRFLGYANEIGESFRYQFPAIVRPSYAVAFGYCALDSISCGYRIYSTDSNSRESSISKSASIETKAFIASFDTLLWQSLASVMIPGTVINGIVRTSKLAVSKVQTLPKKKLTILPIFISKLIEASTKKNSSNSKFVAKWIPTMAGLGSIPFIIHPIDNFVDFALDNSTRKYIYDCS